MINFKIIAVLFLFCAFEFSYNGQQAGNPKEIAIHSVPATNNMRLKITIGDKVLYAKFKDGRATRDFIKQLPLMMTMGDLKGREKYASLSAGFSKEGPVTTTFQQGDISYWLGGGLAIFYNQDNSTVKAGLIVLAHLDKGVEVFRGPEQIVVKFEAIEVDND